ncbi:origin recognition complex subunit 5 [Lycorma delicatula]|uniref:origin recognition complex subunit 5 n=1 Tax=Lycorma delicatula TaxID=130591 RepID=UPI003F51990E
MDIRQSLFLEFPCRVKQIEQLCQLIGVNGECLPSSVFIYGQTATGKSSIVKRLLQLSRASFHFANCIECYTTRLLLEPMLEDLIDEKCSSKKNISRCDNIMILVNQLKIAASKGHFNNRSCFIVLDGCERLSNLGWHYLPAFSKLQELTNIKNLCVIFISHILPEKFIPECSYIKIHFPQYSKDELLEILMLNKPDKYPEDFYKNYLNTFLSIFLRVTRDLNEVRHLAALNFPKYIAPIESKKLKMDDVSGLWRNIAPHLKNSLNDVYLGIGSNHLKEEMEKSHDLLSAKAQQALDLPYFSKYFLVAAFLASHNSPKYDRRLFMKHHGKNKKRIVQDDKRENMIDSLLGPRNFTLDRLFAIFYSLLDQRTNLTASLMSQVSSLVELRFLLRLGDGLDSPKYKTLVGLECVEPVARTLGLNIRKYMIS